MKDVQTLIKIMTDGLKTLAQGVGALADKVEELAKTQSTNKPQKKKPSTAVKETKAVKRSRSERKAPKKKITKQATATETVIKIVARSKKGVSTTAIMEKTGYDRKKVANIIYRLGKQGKIKSVAKGVYVKS
jgi:X-X-X-Leu-X-X-Gly heptad repeat protein